MVDFTYTFVQYISLFLFSWVFQSFVQYNGWWKIFFGNKITLQKKQQMIEKSIVTGEYGTYIAKKKKGIQDNLLPRQIMSTFERCLSMFKYLSTLILYHQINISFKWGQLHIWSPIDLWPLIISTSSYIVIWCLERRTHLMFTDIYGIRTTNIQRLDKRIRFFFNKR